MIRTHIGLNISPVDIRVIQNIIHSGHDSICVIIDGYLECKNSGYVAS